MQNSTRKIHCWVGVLCLLTVPLFAQEGTFQFLGFPGTGISAITVHPDNDSILYVGASRSLFRSIDAGATWDILLDSLSVTDIVIHPLHPDTIYVNGMGGILKTIDGGTTWTPVNNEFYEAEVETFIQTLAIHTTNPETLYVGTAGFSGGNLYRSVNGGQSWTKIDTACAEEGIGLYDGVIKVAVDPLHPDTVYAGVNWRGEIYKSTDAGSTWAALNTPWGEGYGLPTDIVSFSEEIHVGVSGYGYAKSENGGYNWAIQSSLDSIQWSKTGISLALNPNYPQEIFLGTGEYPGSPNIGIFYSNTNGNSWTQLTNQYSVSTLAFAPESSILYIGTFTGLYSYNHTPTGISTENSIVPEQVTLLQNYPNPFNNQTTIPYYLPQGSQVFLTIYNLQGQMIKYLVYGYHTSGEYEVKWDGTNNQRISVSTGLYFYRLSTPKFTITRSLVYLK